MLEGMRNIDVEEILKQDTRPTRTGDFDWFFFLPVFPERKKRSSARLMLIIILFLWDFHVDVVTTWGSPPHPYFHED